MLNDRLGSFRELPIEGDSGRWRSFGNPGDKLRRGRSDRYCRSPRERSGTGLAKRHGRRSCRQNQDQVRALADQRYGDGARRRRSIWILDGRTDLLGLPGALSKPGDVVLPAWARNDGKRFAVEPLPLRAETPAVVGITAVDLVGDPLPDVLILRRPGEKPALARNAGNGNHWLAIRLGGYWRVKPELMRTNSHGIGTRLTLEGQGLFVPYDHTTPDSGLGQSIAPVVLGLGAREQADLVHLRWPDGVMQCELNQVGDQQVDLAENNRKTGSCPVLFTWNGRRFVCIGDFLGGGGMGYLVAPGSWRQPRPRRGDGHHVGATSGEGRCLPPIDHRADGRNRVSRPPDARRGRPAAGRSAHS